jgi:hypothetical protein
MIGKILGLCSVPELKRDQARVEQWTGMGCALNITSICKSSLNGLNNVDGLIGICEMVTTQCFLRSFTQKVPYLNTSRRHEVLTSLSPHF